MHRIGQDGKTSWERETGRKWKMADYQFGERYMLRPARERQGTSKRDWEPRSIPARHMGYNMRSRSLIGITEDGIVLGTNAQRMPLSDRWSAEGWDKLRGFGRETTRHLIIHLFLFAFL